jgi:hypothetical protein
MTTSREFRVDARLFFALWGSWIALLLACGFLGWQYAKNPPATFYGEEMLRDPEVRREVIRKLSEQGSMQFDSHPDPQVARVLLPYGERQGSRTNAFGMREREVVMPKPAGLVRIVLLGDSYVFGLNIADQERLGAVLERSLSERGGGVRFECLHYAVNSWNLASECEFVRRQLEALQPDLVVQVSVSNDLNDVSGVRGFGEESSFAPRHAQRTDALVLDRYAKSFLGHDTPNLLPRGMDHEGRQRFADALAAVRRLRAALAELPGSPRHLLVLHWGALQPAVHEHLGSRLEPDSVVYLPFEFSIDKEVRLSATDAHWNARGHALVAQLLHGLILTRGLLPQGVVGAWAEAERLAEEWSRSGREFAETRGADLRATLAGLVARIDLPFGLEEARQVHGGLDREGLVSPYASFVLLQQPGARFLRLAGRALPDRSLRGAHTRVALEEYELGTIELAPDQPLAFEAPIPPELSGRELLNVRLESDDYVYRDENLRHCVVFRLERAALE